MPDRALAAVLGLEDGDVEPLLAGGDGLGEVGAGWSAAGDTGQTLQNLQKHQKMTSARGLKTKSRQQVATK